MEPIISLKQVSKSFSGRRVLSGISLNVEKGSTVGIVGANGSGKSVLFNLICGFLIPDSGQVCVRGQVLGKGRDFPENMGVLITPPVLSVLIQDCRICGIWLESAVWPAIKKFVPPCRRWDSIRRIKQRWSITPWV